MSVWYDATAKRWRIRIRRGGVDVAREILPAGVTKDQAIERHARLVSEIFDADKLGKQRHTLAEALKRWAEEEQPRHARQDKSLSLLATLLQNVHADDALEDIPAVARRLADARRHLSPAARNRPLSLLRRVANLAFREWHWLARPVTIRLEHEPHREEYLSRGEAELLAWIAEQWHPLAGDWCLIAVYTGMRQGEIERLKASDVRSDVIYLTKTKTRKPRTVPVLERIREPLDRWISAPNRPKYRALYYHFKRAAWAIGRPELHYHDLRHTAASLLVQAGVDLWTVAEILGAKYAITRYAHLNTEAKRRALERLVQPVTR